MKALIQFFCILIINSGLYAESIPRKECIAATAILTSKQINISNFVAIKDGGSLALVLSDETSKNNFLLIARKPGRLGIPKEGEQIFEICDLSNDSSISRPAVAVIKGSAVEGKLIELLKKLRNNLGIDTKKYKPRIDGFIDLLKDRSKPWPP